FYRVRLHLPCSTLFPYTTLFRSFLSGSIFPLRGVIGGVGFLDIPAHLRDELRQLGIFAVGGGWRVQLPVWIQVLVYINPVSYQLDRKSTRLNSSHVKISYAAVCL